MNSFNSFNSSMTKPSNKVIILSANGVAAYNTIDPKNLVYYYQFNTADVINNRIANLASGIKVYDGILLNSATISFTTKKVGTGALNMLPSNVGTLGKSFQIDNTITPFVTDISGNYLSITCWAYYSSTVNGYEVLFYFGTNGSWTGATCMFQFNGGNPPSEMLFLGNGGGMAVYPIPTINTWTHFAFVIQHNVKTASGGLKVYYNGVLQPAIRSGPSTVVGLRDSSSCYIGNTPADGIDNWQGYVDELRVYKRKITEAEITSLYNAR